MGPSSPWGMIGQTSLSGYDLLRPLESIDLQKEVVAFGVKRQLFMSLGVQSQHHTSSLASIQSRDALSVPSGLSLFSL